MAGHFRRFYYTQEKDYKDGVANHAHSIAEMKEGYILCMKILHLSNWEEAQETMCVNIEEVV